MKIELDNTEEKIVRATFDIIQKEGVAKATTKRIFASSQTSRTLLKSQKPTISRY